MPAVKLGEVSRVGPTSLVVHPSTDPSAVRGPIRCRRHRRRSRVGRRPTRASPPSIRGGSGCRRWLRSRVSPGRSPSSTGRPEDRRVSLRSIRGRSRRRPGSSSTATRSDRLRGARRGGDEGSYDGPRASRRGCRRLARTGSGRVDCRPEFGIPSGAPPPSGASGCRQAGLPGGESPVASRPTTPAPVQTGGPPELGTGGREVPSADVDGHLQQRLSEGVVASPFRVLPRALSEESREPPRRGAGGSETESLPEVVWEALARGRSTAPATVFGAPVVGTFRER